MQDATVQRAWASTATGAVIRDTWDIRQPVQPGASTSTTQARDTQAKEAQMSDIFDDVLGALNFIDRIGGVVHLARHGTTGVQFTIQRIDKGGDHIGADVCDMLAKYGVDTFGKTHDSKNLHFLVRRKQATWAAYLLNSAGIEYTRGVANTTPVRAGAMPVSWAEKRRQRRQRRRTR
jgi:hypothetical protein